MKDETYLFHADVRDKKSTARSARYRRTHNGKSGRVRFPSDNMTKKELNKMNGEVKSYRLNQPMSWKEFKAMPDEHSETYIKLLREKYGVADKYIAKMMGTNVCTFSQEMRRLGLSLGKNAPRTKKFDADGWYAWCGGDPVKQEEHTEEEKTEVVEEATEAAPFDVPVCEETHKAIPTTGNMLFEGKTEEVLKTIGVLLGGAYAQISITWDVLPEPCVYKGVVDDG